MGSSITTLVEIGVEMHNSSDPSLGLGVISANRGFMKSGEFGRHLLLSDAAIARIAANSDIGAKAVFLTTAVAVAHASALPSMIGTVDAVLFAVTGGAWNGTQRATLPRGRSIDEMLDTIRIENQNPDGLDVEPHYVIKGNSIFHNGAGVVLGGASAVSVSVRYPSFTQNFSASSVQCPPEFDRALVASAFTFQFPKGGNRLEVGNYFQGIFEKEMATVGLPIAGAIQQAA